MKKVTQTVLSAPARMFMGSYITKSGQVKNRYKDNPRSYPIKKIVHYVD